MLYKFNFSIGFIFITEHCSYSQNNKKKTWKDGKIYNKHQFRFYFFAIIFFKLMVKRSKLFWLYLVIKLKHNTSMIMHRFLVPRIGCFFSL